VFLPCVSHITLTRERIARELDDRGPEVCLTETLQELSVSNPEILDIATKCAESFGHSSAKILLELLRILSSALGGIQGHASRPAHRRTEALVALSTTALGPESQRAWVRAGLHLRRIRAS
jgi:hypothetical protein